MRAISLWEPWASAMALGIKQNETRSWWTNVRGDLAICSAKRKLTKEDWDTFYAFVAQTPDDLPQYGQALCVVELYEVIPADVFHGANPLKIGETEAALGNYECGRWVWRTRNCRRVVSPVPVVGRQGFWTLPSETAAEVQRSCFQPESSAGSRRSWTTLGAVAPPLGGPDV